MPRPADDMRSESEWLAALTEPTRLAILRALAAGDLNVTEIARAVGAEAVNVSHHLVTLKHAGILSVEKRGKFNEYGLIDAKVGRGHLTLTHASGITVTIPLDHSTPSVGTDRPGEVGFGVGTDTDTAFGAYLAGSLHG